MSSGKIKLELEGNKGNIKLLRVSGREDNVIVHVSRDNPGAFGFTHCYNS